MFKCLLLILVLILFAIKINARKSFFSDNPIVNTKSGKIKGSVLTTRLGENFYAFRGIRYGKPPIDELRYQAPQPVEYWDGIFDATDDGPACTQFLEINQSEDCLRLNVYTKYLPNSLQTKTRKKPVLLQIPGGAFDEGSSLSYDFGGPMYMMERDIVFVSINYRLSVLGMLSLGIREAPGNAALKDQVLAMKWVKDNIEIFGGDSNQITLVGHSAGGLSVLLHLVSPMSKNLFSKAISMSPVEFERKPRSDLFELSQKQAIHVGCTNCSTPQNIYNYLKSIQSVHLVDRLPVDLDLVHLITRWSCVIEPDFGQERFLTEDPYVSFEKGNFAKVPLVIGIGDAEFITHPYNIITNETLFNSFPKLFDYLTPVCFRCDKNSDYGKKVGLDILSSYNISNPLQKEDFPKLVKMYSDGMLGYTIQRVVDFTHKYVDVFYYQLTFSQTNSRFMIDGKPYGVEHADDLKYILSRWPLYKLKGLENNIIQSITRLWAQFAATGNPNKRNDQYIGSVDWKPYTETEHNTLDFGDRLVLKQNLFDDRFKIWYKYYT